MSNGCLKRPSLIQPLKWHGGKHYLARRIIEAMPEHTHYCEPYAGGLSVLLQKDSEGVSEAVNDLHGELTNFWRVLQGRPLFAELYRRLECTPFSQTEFEAAADQTGSMVDQAVSFFVRARQSRQGLSRDYATPTSRTRRGMNENVCAWLTAIEGLPDVHERLSALRFAICQQLISSGGTITLAVVSTAILRTCMPLAVRPASMPMRWTRKPTHGC